MNRERVLIAADHVGLELKRALREGLPDWEWIDLGPTESAKVDYPDFAARLARMIGTGEARAGVLVCGTGLGMSIAANKIRGVRAVTVENPLAARLSREQNDANVLCLGSRFLAREYALEIAATWLRASFQGDEKARRRLEKIGALEG